MKFSLFGISIRLSRQAAEDELSLADLRPVNNSLLEGVRLLGIDEMKKRVSEVSFQGVSNIDLLSVALARDGIVVVPDFLPRDIVDKLRNDIEFLCSEIKEFQDSNERLSERESVLYQRGIARLSGYEELSSYGKSVVQVREGQDDGMVDVFNADILLPELGKRLRPYFESLSDKGILGRVGGCAKPTNLNIYINESVTETRGFHVDSYASEIKAFIYLTDVSSLDDGPYTYVKGSHLDGAFQRLNKTISSDLPNQTEFPVVPIKDVVPVIANRGALVISDQGGAHRGFPQASGASRVVAVMKFKE